MLKKSEKDFGRYLVFAIVAVLLFLSYKIVSPYIIVLVSAFIFAYLLRPIFCFFNKKMSKGLSASICILFIFLIFVIPLTLVVTQVGLQTYEFIQSGVLQETLFKAENVAIFDKLNLDVSSGLSKLFTVLFGLITGFASKLPLFALSFLVFIFSLYFMLTQWEIFSLNLKKFLPFEDKERVSAEIDKSTRGIIFGYLLIACIEFLIASVVFYLLGVKLYLFLAFLIALFVFVPGVGPGFVWVPTAIYYFITGSYFIAGGVVVLGICLALFIETLLMTKIVGKESAVHPLIMLLGIIGGTSLFGIFGFILGPLILLYTIKILESFSAEI